MSDCDLVVSWGALGTAREGPPSAALQEKQGTDGVEQGQGKREADSRGEMGRLREDLV